MFNVFRTISEETVYPSLLSLMARIEEKTGRARSFLIQAGRMGRHASCLMFRG